jgi:hypothetical protein
MTDREHDDGLTDEERAALEDGDEDTGTTTTDEDGAGTTDDDTGTEAEAAAGEAEAGDGTANADTDAEGAAEAPAPAEIKEPASAPLLVVESPADADDRLKTIATQKEDLITQFDDGEITAKEYQQQLDALAKQEREIERAMERAALAAEMEQQRLKNEWTSTVNAFIEANAVYKENPRLYRALDQEVRDVANSEEGKTMSGARILAKAHENLAQAFGFAVKQPTGDKGKTIPRGETPPSLHGVPAADANDVSGGKYSALDRLASTNPIAYEEALMKLPDSERDAYLASQ